MSETGSAQQEQTNINVPPTEDFDTTALQGSMQQVLADNIGKYVSIEFLIGTQIVETQTGSIYDVGIGFVALRDSLTRNIVVCDVFSIKFVTFFPPDYDPATGESAATAAKLPGAQSAAQRPSSSQAAFNYAKRKARRN
ncbi:MAG: hypothetical protein PHY12_07695 [Eubacteriales bacterium]|nr:hypothetical protein [Eubacteriales bacterium]